MPDRAPDVELPTRPLALFGVAVTGVFASAALGAVTNAINGWICPEYFVAVMRWHLVIDVWRASIANGIYEGALFGTFFSLLFAVGIGIITRVTCPYLYAIRYLLGTVAGAFVCWMVGGIIALMLASLSPEFYRATFDGVPNEFSAMLRYAWVGGSIVGVQMGGLVCVFLGLVVLGTTWIRKKRIQSVR